MITGSKIGRDPPVKSDQGIDNVSPGRKNFT